MSRQQLARKIEVLQQIQAGLAGTPFHWGDAGRQAGQRWAAECGYPLVSETAIRKHRHTLRPKARPVGYAYFGAPIQRTVGLYVLGLQTRAEEA